MRTTCTTRTLLVLVAVVILAHARAQDDYTYYEDLNTESNTRDVVTLSANYFWDVNTTEKTINGTVEMTFKALTALQEVWLDIVGVEVDKLNCQLQISGGQKDLVSCTVPHGRGEDGNKLVVKVSEVDGGIPEGQEFTVTIPFDLDLQEATGVQYLSADQTAEKRNPILYTESVAVYARTIAPLQDSPSVRFSWQATVKVPISVKSVYMPTDDVTRTDFTKEGYSLFVFTQDFAVPAYSLALVIGDFYERPLGQKVVVVAQQGVLDYAEQYFQDSDTWLATIEEVLDYEYKWQQLRIIVMPPSFPLPYVSLSTLIMVSPSVIPLKLLDNYARMLVTRAMAQQFLGIVVAPANWTNVWLSEGISVFVERQIARQAYGSDEYQITSLLGNDTMYASMLDYGLTSTFSKLLPDTTGVDPIRAINAVTQEKGFQLLVLMQSVSGELNTLEVLREWVDNSQFAARDAEDFRATFTDYVTRKYEFPDYYIDNMHFDEWYTQGGLPSDKIQKRLQKELGNAFQATANRFGEQFIQLGGAGLPANYQVISMWNTPQVLMFLNYLYDNIGRLAKSSFEFRVLKLLDRTYDFQNHPNLHVQAAWITLCAKTSYADAVLEKTHEIVSQYGNHALIVPIYRALCENGLKQKAVAFLDESRYFYHPITVQLLDEIVFA